MTSTSYPSQLFIDGRWVDSAGDEALPVINPASEQPITVVPQASVADAQAALRAARTAFDDGPWPRMTPRERGKIMLAMADILDRRVEELIALDIAEAGSTKPVARYIQVLSALEHFRDIAENVLPSMKFDQPLPPYIGPGEMMGIGQGIVALEPRGVASLITAFNFPLALNLFKLAPALAAGCTTVLKPSPETPLEALILGEVAAEAGLPAGVLNVITGGVAASTELTTNPMVDIISFTGSDAVGRLVYAQAAPTLKKVVLELGGKSANIIHEDADLDRAAEHVILNFTTHSGQGCALLTRTLVHESVHDELVSKITARLARVTVGDPSDPDTGMGPLISESQRDRVEALIRAGIDEGAQLAHGGGRPAGLDTGYYVEPTLFTGVDNTMTIARTEVFGPVSVVIPFRDDDDAVHIANDSDFGLNGGVWSADPVRALATARRVRTGMISINGGGGGGFNLAAPFGGYKQSGIGREWSTVGVEEFLQHKSITWSAGK